MRHEVAIHKYRTVQATSCTAAVHQLYSIVQLHLYNVSNNNTVQSGLLQCIAYGLMYSCTVQLHLYNIQCIDCCTVAQYSYTCTISSVQAVVHQLYSIATLVLYLMYRLLYASCTVQLYTCKISSVQTVVQYSYTCTILVTTIQYSEQLSSKVL